LLVRLSICNIFLRLGTSRRLSPAHLAIAHYGKAVAPDPSRDASASKSAFQTDGYTIAIAGGTTWLTPLIQKTSYDAMKEFSPVTLVYSAPFILVVHPSAPAKAVNELIDLAKTKPGVLNIAATASPGGQSFLAAELFKSMAGGQHGTFPYKAVPRRFLAY
jgi:tripartite-type tricarboxylate transporter receptor subunit TctC